MRNWQQSILAASSKDKPNNHGENLWLVKPQNLSPEHLQLYQVVKVGVNIYNVCVYPF